MNFTSFEFIAFFFGVVLIRNCFTTLGSEKWFLLASSYAFYLTWSVVGVVLIFLTSLVNYLVGIGLHRIANPKRRRICLFCGLAANVSVLVFFKYTNFVLDSLSHVLSFAGLDFEGLQFHIVLPVGISFFTFIGMTYSIDTYRRNLQEHFSFRDVLLSIAFFPHILSGPINRAFSLLSQFDKRQRASVYEIEAGLLQFGIGAVKKLVISDQIANHVNLIFASPGSYDGFTLLQGMLGYSVQIYCDFSGYTDMAIACARMMGFSFVKNFQMPYSAVNISDFWRRWHISLSSWFRDYLYIPLGGNRNGAIRTYWNLMLTMLVCGLWHGASWNFVFWGGLHGLALAIHRAWKRMDLFGGMEDKQVLNFFRKMASRMLTLCFVCIAWVFFRAESWSSAWDYLGRVAVWSQQGTSLVSPHIWAAVGAVGVVHLLMNSNTDWVQAVPGRGVGYRIAAYSSLLLIFVCFGATDSAPFIYFQF